MRLLTLLAVLCATPLCAATLTVTNLSDSGAGSLRATVAAAAAGDEIVFDASLAGGTINFASVISPAVALTITGPVDANGKPNLTLDGGDTVRFFTPAAAFTLNNLRLFDGRAGTSQGVVQSNGYLVINNCVFESNAGSGSAPVLVHSGFVLLTDCTFIGNSGGAFGTGGAYVINSRATVRRCAFVGNTGWAGGILFSTSSAGSYAMEIEDSTFSGNSAPGGLAGAILLLNMGAGGADASVAARRCTFSDNQGPTSQCVLITSQASGLATACVFTARECIFTDSVGGLMFNNTNPGPDGFVSLGYNICSDAPAWMNAPGDQVSTNPSLAALADNGGLTPTHAIDATSPAYNAAISTGPELDQRSRPRDATPDIGAFELQGADMGVAEGAAAVAGGGTVLGLIVAQPGSAQARTFTISNAATAEQDLTITLPVAISGQVNCTASVTTQPTATLPPGASSDLIAEATPVASGFFQYTVTVSSNDPDAPAFTFVVAGYAHKPGSKKGRDNEDGCSTGASSGYALLLAMLAFLGAAVWRMSNRRAVR